MKQRGFEFISSYQDAGLSLPERKTAMSAGYDIAAAESIVIPPRQITMIPTGLKAYMEQNEYLGIHIRSSLAIKNKLMLVNSQGIIDADYYNNPSNEGHILVAVYNLGEDELHIDKGVRIAQGIFYKFLGADHDTNDNSQVRTGGFGSTGHL